MPPPRLRWIAGSATLTTEASRNATNEPRMLATRTSRWARVMPGRLHGFPARARRRPAERVEDRHVLDRILQRDRRRPARRGRAREQLGEDRVLVDRRELDPLRGADLEAPARLDHQLRRLIGGRVPGVQEIDVPLAAQDLRPLLRG